MEKKKSNSKSSSAASKKKATAKKTSTAVKTTKLESTKKSAVDLQKVREEEKPKVDLIKPVKRSTEKSIKNFDFMKYIIYLVGALLIVLGILFNVKFAEAEILGLILGDVVIPVKLLGFLMIGATGVVDCVRAEKNSLLKSILVIVGCAILGAWIFPNGSLSGSSFVDAGTYGITVNDIVSLAYNGVYMCIDKILVLVFIALFYKIAEKTGAYHKMVDKIVKPFKGKGKNVALLISVIMILLVSFITETYMVLFFIPLFISILAKLKVDKITSFAVTFGALIAGTIGSPYGTEGLTGFNYYVSLSLENGLMYRVILQLCVVALFAIFINLRMKENSKEEAVEEQFLTEEGNKKINEIPLMVLFGLTVLSLIVGFTDWFANFGFEKFQEFNTWLFELTIGEISPFTLIFGEASSVRAIGEFNLFDGITIIMFISLLMVLAYKIKFEDILEMFIKTLKFLIKPILVIVLITSVFTVGYMTQFMSSIGHYILELTPEFNPYSNIVVAAISGIFHSDLAFTGYVFSAYFAEKFIVVNDVLGITYTSISGLVQLLIPTSPLLIGLYYTKVPYKSWIKYISLFFAGMLIVIIILLTVITYIG